jgi:hypothetical protein
VKQNNKTAHDGVNQARKRMIDDCNPEREIKKLKECVAGENDNIIIFLKQESQSLSSIQYTVYPRLTSPIAMSRFRNR